MSVSTKKPHLFVFSWVSCPFWARFWFYSHLSMFANILYIYRQSCGWVLSPGVCVCCCLHVGAHACVQMSVSSLWTVIADGMFCCLFTVCYLSSFCLRELHGNADHCFALFFAACLFLCVFFFPPFRYWDAELAFLLPCERDFSGTRYVAVHLGA